MSKLSAYLKNIAPTVLSIAAIGEVVATAILAAKASRKAELHRAEVETEKGRILNNTEVVLTEAPVYIPAIVVGVSTVMCILGANVLNRRQQAALTSAYALAGETFRKYRNKVKDIYGEEAHRKILEELDVEQSVDTDIQAPGLVENSCLSFEHPEERHIFVLETENRRFESTFSRVLEAEYHLNRNYVLGGAVELNELYGFLGLKETEFGSKLGWSVYELELYWIDFNHIKTTLPDGTPCFHIEIPFGPSADFCKYL